MCPIEPWSAGSNLVEGLRWQFETTHSLLQERLRNFGSALDEAHAKYGARDLSNQQTMQLELKGQLSALVEYTFAAYEDRLLFLSR